MKFLCLLTTLILPFYANAEAEASSESTEGTAWSSSSLLTTGLWAGGIYATTLASCRFFAGPFSIERQNCNNIAAVVSSATIVVSSAAKKYGITYGNDGLPVVVEEHEEL